MNYASMIEEKNLKKTFIIATLCSTLIGTFTASMGLWDRVAEKRKQRRSDEKQNKEIEKLKVKVGVQENETLKGGRHGEYRGSDGYADRRDWAMRYPDEELGTTLARSGDLIRREYEDSYARLGPRFALGDSQTELQLQAQIISLQKTVIDVLQTAYLNQRPLTHSETQQLASAAHTARNASIDALRSQSRRLTMVIQPPPPQAPQAPQAPLPPPRLLPPTPPALVDARLASPITLPKGHTSGPRFCSHSLSLQSDLSFPLFAPFAPGGDNRCPACGTHIPVSASDFWLITKRTAFVSHVPPNTSALRGSGRDGDGKDAGYDERVFQLGQRFVVKCHLSDGTGYACVLCHRSRGVDVVCKSVESLVTHVGGAHGVRELEREGDLWEVEEVKRSGRGYADSGLRPALAEGKRRTEKRVSFDV